MAAFRGARSAQLVFSGVDLAGTSFEGRVYLNRPGADERTPRTPGEGYAGSFHVYGYGEPAPPAVDAAKARMEGDGPVAPIEKRVHVDETALRTALTGSDELTVTVVPVSAEPGGSTPERPFEQVEVVFEPATMEG
ncbi:MAG TPA: hypothetical protein VNB64_13875 [Solirubrobacteraceae bacterium]|nr:hypothetical protein [Solirubrobacteraceae bacterium]